MSDAEEAVSAHTPQTGSPEIRQTTFEQASIILEQAAVDRWDEVRAIWSQQEALRMEAKEHSIPRKTPTTVKFGGGSIMLGGLCGSCRNWESS